MELFPAIDLRGGHCVRLYQGDFARETRYGDDPVGQASGFAAAGAPWVHVVDLDAARTGVARNRSQVAAIAQAVDAKVQSGGGVRDVAAAEALLADGVDRVVVGTAALEDPAFVRYLAGAHPGKVAVGLDAHRRAGATSSTDRWEVAVRGWVQGSGRDLLEVAKQFEDVGVAALVVTEIGRDGTLGGPDLDGLARVLDATTLDVVASGGVGSLDDLRALAGLQSGGRRLAGAIVGRALYEKVFTLDEALDAVAAA
jgi:phosphoribosylformimino-5-aminoimidazole carboxamide ribotide isomerase